MLYPARRVWKLKLESCRLVSLEENILGHVRHDDIPGSMIPAVYFDYLEDRDASAIKRVLEHNELDILSMVSLLCRLSAMLQDPMSESDGGLELLGISRIFEAHGRTGDMVKCLEACTDSGRYDVKLQAVKRLTTVYKRENRYDLALEHWHAIESESSGFDLFHLIEMAKYYEHKEKNPGKALQAVEKAFALCRRAGITTGRHIDGLSKRRDRLTRKIMQKQHNNNPDHKGILFVMPLMLDCSVRSIGTTPAFILPRLLALLLLPSQLQSSSTILINVSTRSGSNCLPEHFLISLIASSTLTPL